MATSRKPGTAGQVKAALAELKRTSTKKDRDNLTRFGITAGKAYGVSMRNIQVLAKHLGRSHELAAALWDTGWYEARLLTRSSTSRRASRRRRWIAGAATSTTGASATPSASTCSTARRTRGQGRDSGATEREEFVKRAAFALLASLALHDKTHRRRSRSSRACALIERAADDDRNFVKKGVSWALRGVGRRNAVLNTAALEVSRRLAASPQPAARWIGKDAHPRSDEAGGEAPARRRLISAFPQSASASSPSKPP